MKSVLSLSALLFATFVLKPQTASATNGALEFNGTGAYIETGLGVIPSSGDFSVEVWYYCPAGFSGRREILSQGSQGNALYIGRDIDGRLRMGDTWYDAPVAFPADGGWHHLALVKSSTDTRLYIDGVFLISKGAPIANPAIGDGLRLGSQYGGYGEYWQGELDDVRIWNRVLSADEIQANYRRMPDGTETGLVAAWEFDENANNLSTSIGSNRITCTLGGAQWTNSGVPWIAETPYEEPVDYAVAFNGTGAYLETGTALIPTSGDFSVEFWAVCPSSSGHRNVLSQGTYGQALYIGKNPDNTLRLGDGWWDSGIVFPIGGWHHFALVKSGTDTVFYLDGIVRARKGSAIPNPTAGTGLRIGAQFGSYGEYWAGGVDDVRIWNRALSAEEIRINRFLLPEADASGLVAAWEFNEGPGQNGTSIGSTPIELSIGNGTGWMASPVPWLPKITLQPESVTAFEGSAAQLSVSASGHGPFSYQWFRENRGVIAGATNAVLSWSSLSMADADIYYAEISNANGTSTSRRAHVAPHHIEIIGENPMLHPVHASFTDPGARLTTLAVGIAAGGFHGLAIKADGSVVGWGRNSLWQATPPPSATNVVAIAGGSFHSLALKTDLTVVGWGSDQYYQRSIPTAAASNVTAVAAGGHHSLALKTDGSVVAWGRNDWGQSTVPATATNVVAIAANELHSLALKADGSVVAWGYNYFGQCNVPASATNVVAIASGGIHNLALKADGSLLTWGSSSYGLTSPPASATNIIALAAGYAHSLALKADGSVVAWGYNEFGQCNVPASATNVVAISANWDYNLALKADGSIVVWGSNSDGQLNVPLLEEHFSASTGIVDSEVAGSYTLTYSITNSHGEIAGITRVVEVFQTIVQQPSPVSAILDTPAQLEIEVGDAVPMTIQWYRGNGGAIAGETNAVLAWSSLALDDADVYYAVVSHAYGSEPSRRVSVTPLYWQWIGDNPMLHPINTPFSDPGATVVTPVLEIAASAYHSMALKADRTVAAWGYNNSGQCNVPASATNAISVAVGWYHSLAAKADGSVVAWGNNDDGEITVPSYVNNVVAVSSKGLHNLALKADGSVVAWGYNAEGQTTVPSSAYGSTAVSAGGYHNLALKSDGSVVAWGYNHRDQSTVPPSATHITAVSAGWFHSMALKADGSILVWGDNAYGQRNVPASATNITAISAGWYHNLALKADGSVVAWGWNNYGQCNVPASATNVVALAAGQFHNLALRADGSVIAWGQNHSGQCNVPSFSQTLWADGTVDTETPGTYTLTYSYTNSAGQVISTNRTVEVFQTIATQPTSICAIVGNPAELQVQVGDAVPVSFQWYRVGYGAIVGASNAVLSWSSLSVADAGYYYVEVSHAYGAETSRQVRVTPVNWAWNGGESLRQPVNTPFIDPGAVLTLPVIDIAAGGSHSLALKIDGSIVAWGNNDLSQCNVPVSAANATAIAAGGEQSLALKADGSVVGWGTAEGTTEANITAIAAGSSHILMLKPDGSVIARGANYLGQCNVPASVTNVTAIAAGHAHSLVLNPDGSVVAWGYNPYGQCNVPASATNVTDIAAGKNHSLALKADGSVVGWGYNCTVPISATNVTAIAAGWHSLALKADGSVIAWGDNSDGQCNVPSSATNVVALAAGTEHSLALRSDGSVIAWGRNDSNQCNVPSFSQPLMATGGTVDTSTPGTYTLTYSYTNGLGQVFSATRTVEVISTQASGLGITNITFNAASGTFGFDITAASGGTVIVESCTNLANPVWIPVQTNTLNGSPAGFIDAVQSENPSRFYRLRTP